MEFVIRWRILLEISVAQVYWLLPLYFRIQSRSSLGDLLTRFVNATEDSLLFNNNPPLTISINNSIRTASIFEYDRRMSETRAVHVSSISIHSTEDEEEQEQETTGVWHASSTTTYVAHIRSGKFHSHWLSDDVITEYVYSTTLFCCIASSSHPTTTQWL